MSELAPDAPTLCWSTGRNKTTATWNPINNQSWSSFVRWLKPDQPAASKEVRPYVGGTLKHGRRTSRTVEQRYFLTLDADYADVDFPFDVAEVLPDTPYVIHTTWRHHPEAHRYRLIIPLSRGTDSKEYKELAWAVMNRLDGSRFDVTTAQAERFMWSPSTQDEATYFWTAPNPQAPYLPVDEWLDGRHGPSEARGQRGGATTTTTRSTSGTQPLETTPEDKERAEEIWASAVHDVLHLREHEKFAGRNEAVFHMMPVLLQFADAGLLDEDLVLDSLFDAAQQVPADEPYTREEFEASVASARAYADEKGPTLPETTATKLAQADFADVEVEEIEDLWEASPQLRHIAQAADCIGRNRLAMLAAVLVRILVQVEPRVLLAGAQDGSVGSRAALNLGVVLVGQSGQGKSTIQDESRKLLPETKRFESKPSTGQGLIQAYLEYQEDTGEQVLVTEPNKLWIFDEIDTLAATAADKTSTLLSEARTMLTGGMTGTANATASRRRHLDSRSYNFQMIVNAQPSRAGVLLNDRDGGTPQRFIWATVTDKRSAVHPKDRPPWPGQLDWSDVFTLSFNIGDPVVDIPQWLKDELLDYDYAVSQEGMEGGALSKNSHKNLLRLKVATGIAFLHQSPVVTDEYVHLADLVLKDSYRVQQECERLITSGEFTAKLARVRSESRVVDIVEDEKLQRLLDTALRKLRDKGDWANWHELRPQYRDRAAWEEPLWEALEQHDSVEIEQEEYGQSLRRKARWVL